MAIRLKQYVRPQSKEECLQLMQDFGENARLIAGGTDLVIKMKNNGLELDTVIDISSIEELKKIDVNSDGVIVGSALDLISVSKAPELSGQWDILRECAGHVSSLQIRNLATLGGNSCNASPSADTVPALLISDAKVLVESAEDSREIPIEDFFVCPGQTVLKTGELVTGFKLPNQGDRCEAAYYKHAIRGDTDISIVCVGVRLQLDENEAVTKARVALGAVAPTPIRALDVEEYLTGKKLTDDVIEKAAQMAADGVKPISDQRATKEYRREMICVGVKNMIREANSKIKGK